MGRFVRRAAILAIVIALVTSTAWFGGRWYLARSVAQYSGETRLSGLVRPVEVSFDARGVPRVTARTNGDLFQAIGYLQASERLFQMELVRRMARGELAEIFGEVAYDSDVRQRRLGFARQARSDASDLSPRGRELMQRFVQGINAWIRQADPLPPEFVVLRFTPHEWTVEDCLAVALYQTWFSHELMATDDAYSTLLRRVGVSMERILLAPYPWSPPTVTGPLGTGPFPLRASEASNSWAISPARTLSGKAIHAADPHLAVNRAPGLWYLASLRSDEGLEVVGVMQPGLPLVVMGHNGSISYAFTVASVDIVDTFEETIEDGAPAMVVTWNGPVEVKTVSESIRVKGEDQPRLITVEITPDGPLIEREPGRGVALHWAGFDRSVAEMVDAGIELMTTDSFDEFRGVVTRFGALDANWVYSDRNGNIGYQLGVPVPFRDYSNTFARQPGGEPSSSWLGYVPLEATPYVFNPAAGWVASCNNQIVGEGWPYPMPGFYDPYRITRAAAFLEEREGWTQEEAEAMQLDLVSGRALRWKNLAARAALEADLGDVGVRLRAWDGKMSADSTEAAIFAVWWQTLGKGLFHDDLGDDWTSARPILEKVLSGNAPELVDDKKTPQVETLKDVTSLAMSAAVALTNGRTYGEISTLQVTHPLSRVKILDRWLRLSRGPVPMGGDSGSLNANFNRFDEKSGTFTTSVGPSMRFVLDWADVDAFSIAIAFGQSGNPFSPHYDDFFVPSLEGQGWNLPFSREAQKENEASVLMLVP